MKELLIGKNGMNLSYFILYVNRGNTGIKGEPTSLSRIFSISLKRKKTCLSIEKRENGPFLLNIFNMLMY